MDKRVRYSANLLLNFINWGHVDGGCSFNGCPYDRDDCVVDSKPSIEGSSGFD